MKSEEMLEKLDKYLSNMTPEELKKDWEENYEEINNSANWPESGNLSEMAHDYAKEMEEVYHNKIAQGLFSCVYNAWLDGFMKGISFNKKKD